jgi:hypothetical protein
MSRKLIAGALVWTLVSAGAWAGGPEPLVRLAPLPDDGLATNDFAVPKTAELAAQNGSRAGAAAFAEDQAICGYPSCRPVYVQADALYWDRVGTGCDRVLAVDTNVAVPGDDTLLTGNDLRFGYAPGMRVLVGWRPDPCRCCWCSAWELSYFGLFNWHAGAAVTGDNNLAIPGTLGLSSNNFYGSEEIRADYNAELHNLELNCIKSCCLDPCTQIDFLCGFRFLALFEDFALTGTDLQEPANNSTAYHVSTENYLYGFQMGGRLRRNWECWAVELWSKAGVFLNDAQQRQGAVDSPLDPATGLDFPLRDLTGSDGQNVAALGELGVTFIRRITDCWSVRIGYQVLGIGGLALAPDQLDFNNTLASGTALHKDGWIFLHGAHVGVEACW